MADSNRLGSHSRSSAYRKLASLVDPKVGIIRSVQLLKLVDRDPDIFIAYAEATDTRPLSGILADNKGGACSLEFEDAVLRACGESIERYCSSFFDFSSMRLASESELEGQSARFISVRDLYPFHETQFSLTGFPFSFVSQQTPIRWVRGTGLFSREQVYVPASCVYVPYRFDTRVEPFTHMSISTGLAAGPNQTFAIEHGIFEILERDALMISWYSRIPTVAIAFESVVTSLPEFTRVLMDGNVGPHGTKWHFNLLSLDTPVPIVSAALIDESSSYPLTSFGVSSDRCVRQAIRRAIDEALLSRVLLNRSTELSSSDFCVTEVRTLRAHLLAHASSYELRCALGDLTASKSIETVEAIEARFNKDIQIADVLSSFDHEPVWVDVTTPDVEQYGVSVVRTVLPNAQPLDNDDRYRFLGGKRLVEVPKKYGIQINDVFTDLRQVPHPFP